jgi:hypothetical protein
MSVKVPQIQKRNHGLLLQADKRNLQLFREIIIQKKDGSQKKTVGRYGREEQKK